MSELSRSRRTRLPDTAFAHIRPDGRRMLPIHDAAHVRNALARFEQVRFEDDAARDRARRRLLAAARRHGIVPVGFVDRQVRQARHGAARAPDTSAWPTGTVTFLMTDIEGSTGLIERLGDGYGDLLDEVRRAIREVAAAAGGHEVDLRADESFWAFGSADAALTAASGIVDAVERVRDGDVRLRVGVHTGRPQLRSNGYVGLAVHAAARIAAAGRGGHILVSGAARDAASDGPPPTSELRPVGTVRLAGISDPVELWELAPSGMRTEGSPLR